jgi:hypothetical protein
MCSTGLHRYRNGVPALEAEDHPISRRAGVDRRLLGMLLVAIGILWFIQTSHIVSLSAETLLAGLLMVLGGGLLVTARRGRRLVLPVALGVVLTIALAGNSNSFRLPSIVGVSPREIRPLASEDIRPAYHGGVGNLTLDLSQLPPAALDRQIVVHLGVGNLLVIVPPGTDVQVDSHLGVGKLTVCGRRVANGFGIGQQYHNDVPGASFHLRLVISNGVGDVQVLGCQPAQPARPAPPTPPGPPATSSQP